MENKQNPDVVTIIAGCATVFFVYKALTTFGMMVDSIMFSWVAAVVASCVALRKRLWVMPVVATVLASVGFMHTLSAYNAATSAMAPMAETACKYNGTHCEEAIRWGNK